MINVKELKKLAQNFNVLYVEDDSEIQKIMGEYLENLFKEVSYASNGIEGMQKYQIQSFDIVVTDLSMPKMDGLVMIKQMKKLHLRQPVLITTAHTESEYMYEAIKLGIDGYIIKPFDNEQLLQELYKVSEKLAYYKKNETCKYHLQELVDEKTSELQHLVEMQADNYDKTLFSMVEMIEQRDTYTAGHSKRVAKYSKRIAEAMDYTEEECKLIYQAGILHDIGKIATPDTVLLNPKKLNKIEYKLIQEHVEVGFKLLDTIPMFKDLANIVHSHHEHYDGSGYPRSLKADEIHPLSHIMILADAFDAMTTNRIYKASRSVEEVLSEIQTLSAKQFHPKVVEKAVVVLRNINLDGSISQLPNSKLEEERFAYFYKDILSELYNQNYLDVVLMKNSYTMLYNFMDIISMKKFTLFNKENGWEDGDILLKNISDFLFKYFENALVFRIFGDDFVVLSELKQEFEGVDEGFRNILENTNVSYKIDRIDLKTKPIANITDIEGIQLI